MTCESRECFTCYEEKTQFWFIKNLYSPQSKMLTSTEQQGSSSTTNYASQLFATTGQLSYCDQHLLISTRNGSIVRINSKSLQGLTLCFEPRSSLLCSCWRKSRDIHQVPCTLSQAHLSAAPVYDDFASPCFKIPHHSKALLASSEATACLSHKESS